MDSTKIQFSEEELQLMQNSAWILTKNSVMQKVCSGFGETAIKMQKELEAGKDTMDDPAILVAPKISRGEKYEGLPYLILDYPRHFKKHEILAIRTFFWWGNFCSITLHTRGRFKNIIAGRIPDYAYELHRFSFYVSFSGDEWNHNLDSSDYQSLADLTSEEIAGGVDEAGFAKIAAKIDLNQWQVMEPLLMARFRTLLKLVTG